MGTRIDSDSLHTKHVLTLTTVASVSGGNATYSAANMLDGFIDRDTSAGEHTDTTATAAELVTAAKALNTNVTDGASFYFTIRATGANRLNLSAGTGVSIKGPDTILANGVSWGTVVLHNTSLGSESASVYFTCSTEALVPGPSSSLVFNPAFTTLTSTNVDSALDEFQIRRTWFILDPLENHEEVPAGWTVTLTAEGDYVVTHNLGQETFVRCVAERPLGTPTRNMVINYSNNNAFRASVFTEANQDGRIQTRVHCYLTTLFH